MTDLAAAVGRAQLAKHQDFWRARRDVARRYDAGLADLDAIEPPRGDTPEDQSSWYLYVIRLNTERLSIDRDQFCAELHELGVGTSIHFRPLHTYKTTESTWCRPVPPSRSRTRPSPGSSRFPCTPH